MDTQFFISKRGSRRVSEGHRAEFNTRRSTATELLKQMEKNGLIRRVCVDYDARLKKIVVTDHAEEIRKQIQTQIDKTEKTMTEGFTPAEIEAFFDYVERFKQNLAKCE